MTEEKHKPKIQVFECIKAWNQTLPWSKKFQIISLENACACAHVYHNWENLWSETFSV